VKPGRIRIKPQSQKSTIKRGSKSRHRLDWSEQTELSPAPEKLKSQADQKVVNLDIFSLKDESLEDSANLPDPDVLALEIAEELGAALEQFAAIAEDLKR
jgi:type I restriction enzyme M protein